MTLSAAALALLVSCAPSVGSATMAGLIEQESGWKQFAIGDNTARKSYFLASQGQAAATARVLIAFGHNIDAGFAQINSDNWRAYGLTPDSIFDPCTNIRAGAEILARNYRGALYHFPPGDIALAHALSAYNSGHYYASMSYAASVIGDARRITFPPPALSVVLRVAAAPPKTMHASKPTPQSAFPTVLVTAAHGPGPVF